MLGYRDTNGDVLKEDTSKIDLNFDLKYKLTDNIHVSASYLKGDTFAGSIDFDFPLEPEGPLAWRKTKPYSPGEKIKWDAHESDNFNLSTIITREIKDQGFKDVSVACSIDSVWIEFTNTLHLSDAGSLGQIGSLCDTSKSGLQRMGRCPGFR